MFDYLNYLEITFAYPNPIKASNKLSPLVLNLVVNNIF